jgi:hypothetical protein
MPSRLSLLPSLAEITTGLHRPPLSADPAVRACAATGLMTVGVIHVLEIHGQLSGAAWLTAGFALLGVAAPVAGLWLLARPSPVAWQLSALVCLSAGLGYILTRSVPVPGDTGDAGNWLEPLGVVSLITEAIVITLATLVLASIYGAPVRFSRKRGAPIR